MKVLQLTAHFPPNMGGVETHLGDMVKTLVKRNWKVTVLTYRPLTTGAKWNIYEKNEDIDIFRIPWLPNLFYKLVKYPALEFLYLLPGLFFAAPFVIFFKNPDVVHAHGLVAGFSGVFWGKLFGKRVIISTHSIYHFPPQGLYRNFVKWIFNNADIALGLSSQAVSEIKSLAPGADVRKFTYWIDLNKFKSQKSKVKSQKFQVLFVGRLVEEKGILQLLQAAKMWNKNIALRIIGSGPLEKEIPSSIYLGKIDNDKLPLYYSAADVLIVPSIHEEGFGRVILESLACGTPVIGSSRGAIPEAMDKSVGKLIDVSPLNIKNAVEYFFENPKELNKLRVNARKFARNRYSEENVNKIIKSYTG